MLLGMVTMGQKAFQYRMLTWLYRARGSSAVGSRLHDSSRRELQSKLARRFGPVRSRI
jgi:hypothetical protein